MYFKITNSQENHNGFQYVDGLNILIEKFNENPDHSCCTGGFYFTDITNIFKFLNYGVFLREIKLPIDNPKFKMIKDKENDKWRTNLIILGKRYDLFTVNTFKYLIKNGANIHADDDYVFRYCAQNGHIAIMDWFKNSGFEYKYDERAINHASQYGHIAVLDWFKNSYFEFKYDKWTINYASLNGHIAVLDWFKNSGFKFKYDESAINYASLNGHVTVLDWFKNSG